MEAAAARTWGLVVVAVEGKTQEAERAVMARREVPGPQSPSGTSGARQQPRIWSRKKTGRDIRKICKS